MLNDDYHNILHLIIDALKKYTEVPYIDIYTSFSALGLTSLRGMQLIFDINNNLHSNLKAHDLFLYPTPHALTNYLVTKFTNTDQRHHFNLPNPRKEITREPIAIIAMDCKYPGADNCETFWENCIGNKEQIAFFDKESTLKSRSDSSKIVHARGILNNIEYFDAKFFNYTPKEAHLSDPQHRLFIEAAWNALEKAGYASEDKNHGKVGVYASMNDSTYILDQRVLEKPELSLTDRFTLQRTMSSQFLATKVAYLLNCNGPSINVQTACSSSLVAIVLACQQLTAYECDMAIAGGVSIITPQDRPYLYQKDNIYSPDGHCRPFDAAAEGTVFSNGLGVVILKRLSAAIRDRDSIISVIKGYAINNDGNQKMNYAAPSMQGQLDCILSAQKMAQIEADSIQYVEAHGTGTLIGDPIEVEALTKAFRHSTPKEQFCAIGSVKANIGHTHVAAGVAGLIKASLSLKHQKIPPVLHFKTPNPNIDFKHSPFYINTRSLHWRKGVFPRRAAVSAFGIGGTNAHIILEEAPPIPSHPAKRDTYPLLLSAKSKKALLDYHDQLINFLEKQQSDTNTPEIFANLAYTLQIGRNHYPYRSGIVCKNITEALEKLKEKRNTLQKKTIRKITQQQKIVFLFPGQGSQYVNMSRKLYNTEPIFKHWLDRCLAIASKYMQCELHTILFPKKNDITRAETKIFQTQYAHPILFSVEYALAKLLQHWGIIPTAMLGHSLGEYVAACLSGTFSLEDSINIICARGNAVTLCDEGKMLFAPLSQEEAKPFCQQDISIAVKISSNTCVLSGPTSAILAAEKNITSAYPERSSAIKRLEISHPFHSTLLKKAKKPFLKTLNSIEKKSPKIPYLSNLTGDWITHETIFTDEYWISHLLKTAELSKSLAHLVDDLENTLFIQVGPGTSLLTALKMHTDHAPQSIALLKNNNNEDENNTITTALKTLWCYGCNIDWKRFYENENRNRIAVPTYPFQKEYFWVNQLSQNEHHTLRPNHSKLGFYTPTWTCDSRNIDSASPLSSNKQIQVRWVIFANDSKVCNETCSILSNNNEEIVKIFQEEDKASSGPLDYIINPRRKSEYQQIFKKIFSQKMTQCIILHFWGVDTALKSCQETLPNNKTYYKGLYSGIFIFQTLNQLASDIQLSWAMITTGVHSVLGNEPTHPLKSTVLSLPRVLPLENSNGKFQIQHFDLDLMTDKETTLYYASEIIRRTIDAFSGKAPNSTYETLALRNKKTWILTYPEIEISEKDPVHSSMIDHPAVYLITGGLGGMGLTMIQWLLQKNKHSTVVLISRTAFPEKSNWEDWLANHSLENDISKKIQVLQTLITQGLHIEILQADVADYQRMKTIISKVEKQFGKIQGVFHLAGVSGKGLAALREIDEVKNVLRPKVEGLQVLTKIFHRKKLDFFVAASSLTAIAGGVGQVDYCAANIYLDNCLAQKPLKQCERTLTINWNAWRSIGMAANIGQTMHCQLYAGNSITPEKGIAIFDALLKAPYNQVIVSYYSPENEKKRIKNTFQYPQNQETSNPNTQKKPLNISDILKHGWNQTLGVKHINEKTSFYDYGGDSLTLVQLIAILEEEMGIKISLQDLIRYPKFNAMVSFIESLNKNPTNLSEQPNNK